MNRTCKTSTIKLRLSVCVDVDDDANGSDSATAMTGATDLSETEQAIEALRFLEGVLLSGREHHPLSAPLKGHIERISATLERLKRAQAADVAATTGTWLAGPL
jgi:hypothetical protein